MDKYSKVRNIGKGNMGACALARNNEDGKYYVIKQVDLTRMSRRERQQSLNEAQVLSSLRHPNIINYVDSFLSRKSDHLCIVMEYADGGDLSSRIKKTYGVNLRETQILDWLIQMTLSLLYIHQRKILHRDVKSQNVFLTSDNIVKLGDFGIARTLSGTYDQAKTFVGTPYYLSPELILERPYDHRSDVWALGVVLYELLSLRHPFNASSMKGLMQRILKVQYDPIPPLYTVEMRNIVPRLLEKDPAQRIRLDELLELPIVQRRLREWALADAMPRKYMDQLLRQKLLPAAVAALRKDPAAPPVPEAPPVSEAKERPSEVAPISPPATEPTVSPFGVSPFRLPQPPRLSRPHVFGANAPFSAPVDPAALAGPRRSQQVYLMYKNINGGYNCGPDAPRRPSRRSPLALPRRESGQSARVAPHANDLGVAARFGANAVGGALPVRGDGAPRRLVVESGGRKRSQQESDGVASCLNPFFRRPSAQGAEGKPAPLPYLAGVPQTDIKALLQRAALERAQRKAVS